LCWKGSGQDENGEKYLIENVDADYTKYGAKLYARKANPWYREKEMRQTNYTYGIFTQ